MVKWSDIATVFFTELQTKLKPYSVLNPNILQQNQWLWPGEILQRGYSVQHESAPCDWWGATGEQGQAGSGQEKQVQDHRY